MLHGLQFFAQALFGLALRLPDLRQFLLQVLAQFGEARDFRIVRQFAMRAQLGRMAPMQAQMAKLYSRQQSCECAAEQQREHQQQGTQRHAHSREAERDRYRCAERIPVDDCERDRQYRDDQDQDIERFDAIPPRDVGCSNRRSM